VLVDFPVAAIHEHDDGPGLCWDVSFGETAWANESMPLFQFPVSSTLETKWRRYPDLDELVSVAAGRRLAETIGEPRVRCELRAPEKRWSPTEFEMSHRSVRVGRIVVAPPWIIPDLDGTTIIIRINPSMGFGTGHHPSTRLALGLLQQVNCEGRDVLDVGTGSGLLAIAAAKLGGARVCAIDNDPNAVIAAREGVRRNALGRRVEVTEADITTDTIGVFDVVIANLEATQLSESAAALVAHVRPGGALLLSGFLTAEVEGVATALPWTVDNVAYEDGWSAIVAIDGRLHDLTHLHT
jgi:ribosomal protein L11 methyltransferase